MRDSRPNERANHGAHRKAEHREPPSRFCVGFRGRCRGEKDELRANATRELAKLLVAAIVNANVRPEDGPSWKTHVQYGSPRIIVDKAMKRAETDLLVLGTHGCSGAAYVFLGTVAGDLLRAATCDVLVVPPAPPHE